MATQQISTKKLVKSGPMLNAYPDSIGGTLGDIVHFMQKSELDDAFQAFYILPSVFNTDLDRGFSVIDYELNELVITSYSIHYTKLYETSSF